MTPKQRVALKTYVREIGHILYEDAQAQEIPMSSLGEIEQTVREQLQSYVAPELDIFLSTVVSAPIPERSESSSASSARFKFVGRKRNG